MKRIAVLFATFFGCGYFPRGPGTVGAAAATLLAALIEIDFGLGRPVLLGLVIVLLLPAIRSATKTAHLVGKKDPGIVVIDEVLGQWVALLGASAKGWKVLLAGFLLFRLFDIWKPWPVRQLEKLPEGTGIVIDDLAAGLYGALILYIGGQFGLY
ncbi:MAG TPA: phosphatidylglycerophosphatase A [Bryobacteraceae bacterium]